MRRGRDSYGSDSTFLLRERVGGARAVEGEAADQLVAQSLGRDDVVDDELGGEQLEVDVGAVLVAQLLDERARSASGVAWMRL